MSDDDHDLEGDPVPETTLRFSDRDMTIIKQTSGHSAITELTYTSKLFFFYFTIKSIIKPSTAFIVLVVHKILNLLL